MIPKTIPNKVHWITQLNYFALDIFDCPRLHSLHAARVDEVIVGGASSGSHAPIRSTSGVGAGHCLEETLILPSLRFPAPQVSVFVLAFHNFVLRRIWRAHVATRWIL